MKIRPRPSAGKIAVKKLDLTNEVEITQLSGDKVRLTVFASDNHEGIVAEVIAVCKPWSVSSSPEHVFNPEYDIGEIIVIGKWTGTRLNIDREEFIILREEDVLCTLDRMPSLQTEVVTEAETLDPDEDDAFNEIIDAASTKV